MQIHEPIYPTYRGIQKSGKSPEKYGPGVYFTSSESVAGTLADIGGTVSKARLFLENLVSREERPHPEDVRTVLGFAPGLAEATLQITNDEKVSAVIKSIVEKENSALDTYLAIYRRFYKNADKEFLKAMISIDYDGAYVRVGDVEYYIAYDPNKISVEGQWKFNGKLRSQL